MRDPMRDDRPDPDALLQRLQADEARARRGRLKIFFGASAGVGKTYAMLAAARAAQAQGIPLVVGVVETHGRGDTEAMAAGLPRLALKDVAYRGRTLHEFDLDGALAFGAAQAGAAVRALVLLDELAHSNAPADAGKGSRHPKRWQDVEELLAAGVDVWTTVNVQHLESLNDIVSGITGVRVWETVPDRLFDEADEVVVVDLPPDELLQRLKAGKVYLPNAADGRDNRAERAAGNFFRKGNLLALRELALRRTADRVDDEMQAYRRQSAVQPVWANRESLLACIGPGEQGEKVARSCARLATQLAVPWHAVHVESLALHGQASARREHAARVLKLAAELGATTATLSAPDAATALLRYAREHNLARLVVGRSSRRFSWQRSLADRVTAEAEDIDVLQVAVPAAERGTRSQRIQSPQNRQNPQRAGLLAATSWPWQGYFAAVAICGATALLATPLMAVLELSNIVMLFLLAVVGVALGFGRGPAVLAAFVGVGLFDFMFVEPRFSFAVSDAQYLLTFGVMLVVALVIGQLTAGLKVQAEAATQRERRVRSLYEMSRDLSAALLPEQVAEIGARFLRSEFGAQSTLLVADAHNRLVAVAAPAAPADAADAPSQTVDMGVAQWAFDRGEPAGRGTDTLPGSATLVLPLKAPMRIRGVLSVLPSDARMLGTEQRRLLDTCASLLAISLERIHYILVAQSSTVQIESERLRNSLLSAISHDLRTPLASLIGLADTLALTPPPPTAAQRDVMQSIRQAALRMAALVNNLLDMARLQSGAVQLNLQWQPLEEVVGTALAACKQLLAGRPLQVRLADGLPLLQLDAVLVERVLVNLLENAAKYTPAGSGLELSAQVEGDTVQITLDDHGPGLPRGREEAIFQKFERGQKESATAGVGLGLAICRAIAQVHGGSIEGATRPEGGARFTLTLPRGEPPLDDGAGSVAASAASAESAPSSTTTP